MIKRKELTQEEVKEIFDYDANLGILKWRKLGSGRKETVGSLDDEGYRVVYLNTKSFKKTYRVHRLIWIWNNDSIPDNLQIDHINGLKDDNHIENLRLVNTQKNGMNRAKSKNNKSGHNGVSWNKYSKKWDVRICHNLNRMKLGAFDTKEAAIKARQEADIKYGFHPNHGR